jgi:hypothetical protein
MFILAGGVGTRSEGALYIQAREQMALLDPLDVGRHTAPDPLRAENLSALGRERLIELSLTLSAIVVVATRKDAAATSHHQSLATYS